MSRIRQLSDEIAVRAAEIPRSERWTLGGAIALSFAIVVAYVAIRHGQALAGDQIEYDIEGKFFADGDFWWSTTPFGIPHASAWKAPGYPAWVGVWYSLLGDSPTRVELVQALLAPLTVFLTWLLARRLFNPRVAIASAIVVALFPLVWEYFGLLYSEALAIPLTLWALLLFIVPDKVTPRRAVAVGAVIGLGMLVRPTSSLLFAGVLVSFALAVGFRRGALLTALSVLVAALLIVPWTIRNYVQYDAFLPISVQVGAVAGTFNAESANDPVYPYAWRPAPAGVKQVFAPENAVDDAELERKLRKLGFDYIEEHPLSVAEAFYWNGLSRFWDVRRPGRAMDEVPFEGRSKAVTTIGLAMYYVMLPLAILGLWRARARRGIWMPVLATALAASLVYTIVSGTRYRAPLEPLVAILACSAVLRPGREADGADPGYAARDSSTAAAASVPNRTL